MQREGDLPLHGEFPGRRGERGVEPRLRHTVAPCLCLNLLVCGVEENVELRPIQIDRILDRGCGADAIGVIQQHSEVANAADAGLRADGRLPGFDARIAEDALLRLTRAPVVVDLLVRAPGYAHAPAAALVLIDEYDAVLFPLVDRAGRAGSDTGRIEAVLAQAWQVH